MIKINVEDLASHIEVFFSKANSKESYSSVTQIRDNLKKYLDLTRIIDLEITIDQMLEALQMTGYDIRYYEGLDPICNIELSGVVKMILINNPLADSLETLEFINDNNEFIVKYAAALWDLVEGGRNNGSSVYNDENGLFVLFEVGNYKFKVHHSEQVLLISKLN